MAGGGDGAVGRDRRVLTAEQEAVVGQPFEARVLVTAGAGSGKTHTLVERIVVLADECARRDLDLLSLSFSRAAVRVLRDRLRARAELAVTVRSRTFDGWALELLTEFRSERDWREVGFDDRIRAASELITSGGADERFAENLGHVVVDEVQDLVGDRRRLVEALLFRYDCGFTVVGDLAQSIYGFQVEDLAERCRENGAFIRALREEFDKDLTELALTENFRARTDEARSALPFGPDLRRAIESGQEDDADYEGLRTVLLGAYDVQTLDEPFVLKGIERSEGSTGILCRTNGEALRVAEILAAHGVGHRLRRDARDRAVPAWIAGLFEGENRTRATEQEVRAAAGAAGGEQAAVDIAWRSLRRIAGNTGAVDLRKLAEILAAGRLPEELTDGPESAVLVSSFHRAKGLEFDRAVVVDPGPIVVNPKHGDEVDVGERTRALYVAMTRGRDELWRVHPLPRANLRRHEWTDRWYKGGFKYWQRFGMELTGADADAVDPGGALETGADPGAIQAILRDKVCSGDAVTLRQRPERVPASDMSPSYAIEWDGQVIGQVSERFRRHLHAVLKSSRRFEVRNYPAAIEAVRVDQVQTVAGSEASGQRHGIGAHGVWRAPRLCGLGRFVWEGSDG